MGLFSKTSRTKPTIIVGDIPVEYRGDDAWGFSYRDVEFWAVGETFVMPDKAALDSIIGAIETAMQEMKSRLVKHLEGWCDTQLETGEIYVVGIKDFASEGKFIVTWSGGEFWGDMSIDFTIKDGAILEETASD